MAKVTNAICSIAVKMCAYYTNTKWKFKTVKTEDADFEIYQSRGSCPSSSSASLWWSWIILFKSWLPSPTKLLQLVWGLLHRSTCDTWTDGKQKTEKWLLDLWKASETSRKQFPPEQQQETGGIFQPLGKQAPGDVCVSSASTDWSMLTDYSGVAPAEDLWVQKCQWLPEGKLIEYSVRGFKSK